MAAIGFTAIFCTTIWIKYHFVTGSDTLMNHSDGEIMCKEDGGLINYEQFTKYRRMFSWERRSLDDLGLRDGQSYWVHGRAEMSSAVFSWQGCFMNHSLHMTFENAKCSLHECYKTCARSIIAPNVAFIGMSSKTCHCIGIYDFKKLKPSTESSCGKGDVGHPMSCPKSGLIEVYKLHPQSKYETPGQCITVERTQNAFTISSRSCFSSYTNIVVACACSGNECASHNETCEERIHDDLGNTIISVCFREDNTSWFKSRKECRENKGKLVKPVDTERFRSSDINTTFWTNMFHTFKPIVSDNISKTENHTSCSAVTRVGNDVFIYPDECRVKKEIICLNNFGPLEEMHHNEGLILFFIVATSIIVVAIAGTILGCRRLFMILKTKSVNMVNSIETENRPDSTDESLDSINDEEHTHLSKELNVNVPCNVELHVHYIYNDTNSDLNVVEHDVAFTACNTFEAADEEPSLKSTSSLKRYVYRNGSEHLSSQSRIKHKRGKSTSSLKRCVCLNGSEHLSSQSSVKHKRGKSTSSLKRCVCPNGSEHLSSQSSVKHKRGKSTSSLKRCVCPNGSEHLSSQSSVKHKRGKSTSSLKRCVCRNGSRNLTSQSSIKHMEQNPSTRSENSRLLMETTGTSDNDCGSVPGRI